MYYQALTQFGAEGAAEEGGLAVLGLDPLAFVLQLLTFVILFFVLKRFAMSKIVGLLEERQRTIDKGVDLGREMEAQKQHLDEKVKEILHEARLGADKIIAAGKQESAEIIKTAEATATHKADAMLADAEARISQDIERARRELEKEMVSLVREATEALIGEKLDAQKDASLIQQMLRKVRA